MQGLFYYMNIQQLYQIYTAHPVICTDSRKVTRDCLFFSLKGDNFNGNEFAKAAIEQGAAFAIIDQEEFDQGSNYILVDDVLQFLQQLANYHRSHLKIPVLSITGSNGKTTTKELCRDVLQKKYNVKATAGNLNNHIGVPLTILGTGLETEFLIVEMGANHQGEIDALCKIAEPDYVMITNIGKAHLEGFGGVEGIKKGKSEMYRHAAVHHKKIFINSDDDVLMSLLPPHSETIIYSALALAKLREEKPFITFEYDGTTHSTQLYGSYNISNIAFAIAAGEYFGVEPADISSAISNYLPENNRSQIVKLGTNTVIKDAYNANPTSMKYSIESFAKLDASNKMMILGDMLELGDHTAEEHKAIISLAKTLQLNDVIFIGKNFSNVKNEQHGVYFENVDDAKSYFTKRNIQDCTILLKGSRGIAVEKLIG
jgi:UDP-N-acetylmuramoyl-tripeptide--D-alanyl-D-alanine ligase